MYWILIPLLLFSTVANAETGYRLRLHVFYDSGLKFIQSKKIYNSEATCYVVGERRSAKYRKASPYCEPIHFIDDFGGRYT